MIEQLQVFMENQLWLTLAASLIAALGAATSAFFAWRTYQLQVKQSRRKPLSMEPTIQPVVEWPGCYEIRYVIRNHEPVSARVLTAKSRKRGVFLADLTAAHVSDGMGGTRRKDTFPTELSRQEIALDYPVGASSDSRSGHSSGPVAHLCFYASGEITAGKIKLKTTWADQV